MMRSNLWTVIYGMRTFLPLINKNAEGGTVINTSSGAALLGIPSMSHYNMAKFAVLGISQAVLAEERMYNGGKVNILVVMPSFVTSNLMDGATTIRPAELQNETEEQTDFDKQYEALFCAAVNPRPEGEPLYKDDTGSYTVSNEDAGATVMQAIKDKKQFVYTHAEWAAIAENMGKTYASGYLPVT
jgi:short-subunit dehydrogenase